MSWLSEFPPEIFGNIFSFLSLLELECLITCGSTVVNRKLSSGYIDRLVAPQQLLGENLPFAKVGFIHSRKEDCRNCLVGPLKSFKNIQSIVYRKFRHSAGWCLSLMRAEYFSLFRLDLSVCAHTFELLPEICSKRILLCRTMPSLQYLFIEFLGTHRYVTVELAIQYLFGTLPQSLRSLRLQGESGGKYALPSLVVELPPQLEVFGFYLQASNWPLCPAQAHGPLIEQLKAIQGEANIGSHLRLLPEEVLNRQITLFSILPASLTSLTAFGDSLDDSTMKVDDYPSEIKTLKLTGKLPHILRLTSLTSLKGDNVDWIQSTLPSLQKYTGSNLPSSLLPQLKELKRTSPSFYPPDAIASATNLTSLSIDKTSLILHGHENRETRAIFRLPNLTCLSARAAILDEQDVGSTTILDFPHKLKQLKLESQTRVTRRLVSLLPQSLEHLQLNMIDDMEWDALEGLNRLHNLDTLILTARRAFDDDLDSLDEPDVFWTQDLLNVLPISVTSLGLHYSLEISSRYPLIIPLPRLTTLHLPFAVVDIQSYVMFPSTLTKLSVHSILIHEVADLPLLNQIPLRLPKVSFDRPRIGISEEILPEMQNASDIPTLLPLLHAKPEFAPFYHILHHMWKDLFLYMKHAPKPIWLRFLLH